MKCYKGVVVFFWRGVISFRTTFIGLNPCIIVIYSIITVRTQRIGEGNIFSLCVSSHLKGGVPHPLTGGTPSHVQLGVPPSQVQLGVPPSQVQAGGTLFPGPAGGTPIQVQAGSTPPQQGYPPVQHSVYLLRGGRCASCVHAGGLSCILFYSEQEQFLSCYERYFRIIFTKFSI